MNGDIHWKWANPHAGARGVHVKSSPRVSFWLFLSQHATSLHLTRLLFYFKHKSRRIKTYAAIDFSFPTVRPSNCFVQLFQAMTLGAELLMDVLEN